MWPNRSDYSSLATLPSPNATRFHLGLAWERTVGYQGPGSKACAGDCAIVFTLIHVQV